MEFREYQLKSDILGAGPILTPLYIKNGKSHATFVAILR
jgi:hypothetical protein